MQKINGTKNILDTLKTDIMEINKNNVIKRKI